MPSDPIDVSEPRCHACEYPLRSLPSRGQCPECGEAYDTTHVRWLMTETDLSWRHRLMWGALLLSLATSIPIIDSLSVQVAATRVFPSLDTVVNALASSLVRYPLYIAYHSAAILGAWLLTSPEPGATIKRRDPGRVPARWMYMIAHVWALVMIALSTRIGAFLPHTYFSLGHQVVLLAGGALLLVWMSCLSARVPHPVLSWLCDVMLAVLLVSGIASLGLEYLGPWAEPIDVPLRVLRHLVEGGLLVVLFWLGWELHCTNRDTSERV